MAKSGDCDSDRESLLLVEGKNDCHTIFQLIHLVSGREPEFGIRQCGNDDEVLRVLSSRRVARPSPQKVLGVVLDADIDGLGSDDVVRSRMDQIRSRVGPFYDLPAVFPEDGLILDPTAARSNRRLPRLGVWLMPNNRAFGMFEDLLLAGLPDGAAAYVLSAVERARKDGFARFRDAHLSKATIRTFVAWQDPDIQYLGLAVKARLFPNIEGKCGAFVGWLGRLFGGPVDGVL